MNNKCVLAFSGGLDTSYCARYLQQEKGLEIHSVIVNTGGFTKSELDTIESKAYELGADICTIPPKVFDNMYNHVLTDKGLEQFNLDSKAYEN